MRYSYDFQYMPEGAKRPLDNGQAVDIRVDETQFTVMPMVGDFIHVARVAAGATDFSGVVKTRLFTYLGPDHCHVNIVVQEDNNVDWGALIKE